MIKNITFKNFRKVFFIFSNTIGFIPHVGTENYSLTQSDKHPTHNGNHELDDGSLKSTPKDNIICIHIPITNTVTKTEATNHK